MSPAEMIEKIERCGFHLEVDGCDIVVSPPGRLTDPQRQFLRAHKSEILTELAAANDGPLMVRCWTPAGDPVDVQAKDADHAAWLRRMNPAPKP